MKPLAPQFLASILGITLMLAGFVGYGLSEGASVKGATIDSANSKGSLLKVQSGQGGAQSTGSILQGQRADSLQTPGSVAEPSDSLSNYLQPNSGRGNFTSQDQSPQ